MTIERLYISSMPKTHDERQPKRDPDQNDVCRDLNQSFLPARQTQKKNSNVIHSLLTILFCPP